MRQSGMMGILVLVLAGIYALTGCAAGPSQEAQLLSSGGGAAGGTFNFTTFAMTINPSGQVDTTGKGYYIFLLNANGDPIEVTNLDTFTDMIRFDGANFSWFHRQANVPAPGFTLAFTTNINDNGRVSSDGHQVSVTFNVGDNTSPFNQFIPTTAFTCHCITTDSLNGAVRGQVIDTLGPGPDISNNSSFTVTANKILGAVSPFPAGFPDDNLNDFIVQDTLPPDFPYVNFDIARFEVTSQHQ